MSDHVLRANDAFIEEYTSLVNGYLDARDEESEAAWKALEAFRIDVCRLVCSKDADLWHIGFNSFAVTWKRTVVE